MFKYYDHLGFNNPYYFNCNGKFKIYKDLPEVMENFNNEHVIDPIAIIELLNKNYILADRTIIQGIQRTPWLAQPNEELNEWIYYKPPQHGNLDIPEKEIAHILFQKICTEIETYIDKKKTIGILLSGGMDSRMVAGALDYLIKTDRLKSIKVTALTWGNEGTRDVVYAKEIADRLGWAWKHYTVTANDLLNNIKETALNGCEYSPIHLHALPQIRDDNDIRNTEAILAGSYGDSVGRAEFYGWKINKAPQILNGISNVSHFMAANVFSDSLSQIYNDVARYRNLFPEVNNIGQKEQDHQIHYMRRMLNPCMGLLANKYEFYQVFTNPIVYGFMWSIAVNRRTDLVYKYMYDEFTTKLDDIPWARTGIEYGQKSGKPDSFLKEHHSYNLIIQHVIYDEIKEFIFSSKIEKLNIFNLNSITRIFKLIKKYPINNKTYLEKIIWLAALAKMIDKYNLDSKYKYTPCKINNHNFKITQCYFKSIIRQKIGPVVKKIVQ